MSDLRNQGSTNTRNLRILHLWTGGTDCGHDHAAPSWGKVFQGHCRCIVCIKEIIKCVLLSPCRRELQLYCCHSRRELQCCWVTWGRRHLNRWWSNLVHLMNRWFLAVYAMFILCSSCLFSSTSCLFLLSYFSFQNCMSQMNFSRIVLLFIQFSFYSYDCSFIQEIKQHWTSNGNLQYVELLVYCHKMEKPLYPFVLPVISAAYLIATKSSQDKSM